MKVLSLPSYSGYQAVLCLVLDRTSSSFSVLDLSRTILLPRPQRVLSSLSRNTSVMAEQLEPPPPQWPFGEFSSPQGSQHAESNAMWKESAKRLEALLNPPQSQLEETKRDVLSPMDPRKVCTSTVHLSNLRIACIRYPIREHCALCNDMPSPYVHAAGRFLLNINC